MGPALRHALNVVAHMMSPGRMARRVRLLQSAQLNGNLADLHVPTLVITGEPRLDNVVPVHLTEEYLRLWPHAERVTMARTGHIGLITRPEAFVEAVAPFAERHASVRVKMDFTNAEPQRREPMWRGPCQVREDKRVG
jgi:pimeloyl-ACP methyl ester carboxylesterase